MRARSPINVVLLLLAGVCLVGCGRKQPQALQPELARFIAEKQEQTTRLAAAQTNSIPGSTWAFFEAAGAGDFPGASNLFARLTVASGRGGTAPRPGRFEATRQWVAARLGITLNTQSGLQSAVWAPIMETYGALDLSKQWSEQWLERYALEIMRVVPEGGIYFGGTDAGRFAVSMFSESHVRGVPFHTLTQNALADMTYVDYLGKMYGGVIGLPTTAEQQTAFQDYLAEAQQRAAAGQLKRGEKVQVAGGRVQVSGQVAVMEVNGFLVRRILEKNPDRPVFLEQSLPIDLLKAHLEPHGPIFKLHHSPQAGLPPASLRANREYWVAFLTGAMGSVAAGADSPNAVCRVIEDVQARTDWSAFDGDRVFLQDKAARRQFAQMRLAQAQHYAWRASQAEDESVKAGLLEETQVALQHAWMLWPDPTPGPWHAGSPAQQYLDFLRKQGSATDTDRVSRVVDSLRDVD